MGRLAWRWIACGSLALGAVASPAAAQGRLRIIQRTPLDSGTSGAEIGVMFDRPVAGSADRPVDPQSIIRLEPALRGNAFWRDPVTLRFAPERPLPPGTTLTVTIDTNFAAVDGARLAAPFRFTARIPGPRPVGHMVEGSTYNGWMAVRPHLAIVYSGPVELEALRAGSRLEFKAPCPVRNVALIPTRVRERRRSESFEGIDSYDRDTVADRFQRVVELTTGEDLPAGCQGLWHVPSLDPARPNDTWRYNVWTPHPLILKRPDCDPGPLCPPGPPRIGFAAPPLSVQNRVSDREIARRVRITALRLPRDANDPCAPCAPPGPIGTASSLPAGTIYKVTVDSALRDAYGQRLTGPHERVDTVGNFPARTWTPAGVATVPRNARTIRVEYINAETLTVIAVPIPDSLRRRLVVASSGERLTFLRDTLRLALRDTFRLDVPVPAPRDTRVWATVPLPPQVGAAGSAAFYSVRVWVKTATTVSPLLATTTSTSNSRTQGRMHIVGNEPGWQLIDRGRVGGDTAFYPRSDAPLGLLVQVSDIAVHAKLTGDSAHAFVTSLAAGGPLAGVNLTLYDADRRALARGRTNRDGLARLIRTSVAASRQTVRRDADRSRTRYIEATLGGERVILPVAGSLAGSSSVSGAGDARLVRGAIITDRDMYRPGERVYAKAVARTGILGALVTPRGDSIRWRLIAESGGITDTLWKRSATLSAFGTRSDSFSLPATARVGAYTLETDLRRGREWVEFARAPIRVNEYRAPELEVSIDIDSTSPPREGVLPVPVSAKYLFGAPVVGARVQWSAQTMVTGSSLPKALRDSGYRAGAPWRYWEMSGSARAPAMRGTVSTDSSGHVIIDVPIPSRMIGIDGALQISAAVSDAGNQAVTSSRRIPLPPPTFHIAVRRTSSEEVVEVGRRQEFQVLAIASDGSRIRDLSVGMRVVHQHCDYDRNAFGAMAGGTCSGDTVTRAVATTLPAPVILGFTPDSAGRYDIFFEATDRAGKTAVTIYSPVNADTVPRRSYSYVPPPAAPPLVLRTDSSVHSLGDTARVHFDSPFPVADAWVTREREGVIDERRMTVTEGPVTLRFPITERDAPGVYVGVLLVPRVQGLQAGFGTVDSVTRIGFARLVVDSTAKRLLVDVAARDSISEPGDTVVLRLRVRDASPSGAGRGVRAEVAVWAVDEGVLSLSGFATPALLARVQRESWLGARLHSVFAPRFWRLDPMDFAAARRAFASGGAASPGDPGLGPLEDRLRRMELASPVVAELRADFRSTAFFVGGVVTDDSGGAEVRAKLPDNITTYRLMAVAVTHGDRYGSGEGRFIATRAIVARAALPRFLRRGDELTAGTLLNARDGRRTQLGVTTSVRGAELRGDSTATVSLAPGETGRARFTYRVSPTSTNDAAQFRFTATSDVGSDAVEASIPIRPTGTPRAHTVAGVITRDTTIALPLPADIDPDRSHVTVNFGSSPLAAIRSNYERLRDYPYRSSDVIVSAGSALLALARTERALGIAVSGIDSAGILHDLQRAVDELTLRNLDGWIVFWRLPDPHPHTHAWLTAYAGSFLLEAQQAGVSVRPSLLAAIRRKLTDVARDSIAALRPDTITGSPDEQRQRHRAWLARRVVAARFIRDAGAADSGAEASLLALMPLMAWEDRVVMTAIVAARGETTRARQMLDSAWLAVGSVGKRVELFDSLRSAGSFPSHIRPAARLLSTTMKLEPSHPRIGRLVETVTQQGLAERGWAWNTQDYAAASTALATFAVSQRGSGRRRLVVRSANGVALLARTVGAESADSSVPLTGLLTQAGDSARLTLALSGIETSAARPLYYAITVDEIPLTRPVTPGIEGLVVERWFESFATGAPVSEVTEGDLVRVRLRLTVPTDRQFVVLEDLLPAGLEAVDLSLRTSSALSPFATTAFSRTGAGSSTASSGPIMQSLLYGSWDSGWWSPWEHKEMRDDRVIWFARQLWTGTYTATYIARATTAGRFVLPPAHAEEMYDRAIQGRSSGGVLVINGVPPGR